MDASAQVVHVVISSILYEMCVILYASVSAIRIERVEPGLAADLAGMRVGDYIVFVGSHNVVKMDEDQVLQLIQ